MLKKKNKKFIFVMMPHLMIIEDGSIITDRFLSYESLNKDTDSYLNQ